MAGGTLGGPLIKNKLFGFIAYQHIHDSDQEIGSSRNVVPTNLTNDRSPAGLANAVEVTTVTTACAAPPCSYFGSGASLVGSTISLPATVGTGFGQINPIAYGLLNYKLPNGQYLVPVGEFRLRPRSHFPREYVPARHRLLPRGSGRRRPRLHRQPKDTLALKYYYQHDPSIAPYAYSAVPGFTQHLDAGSQVASITNTQTLTPNLSVAEVFGFIREKVYSTIGQPFTPQQFATYVEGLTGASAADSTINTFGSTFFPGISIVDDLGNNPFGLPYNPNFVFNAGTNIGDGASSQGAFTGSLPESLHALGQRHLDPGQAHHHLRRQLLLHAAEHARRANE